MEALTPETTAWLLPCWHREFCRECLSRWVQEAWTCPLCRSPLAYFVGVTSLGENLLFEIICQADAGDLEIWMDPELDSMIGAMVSDIIDRLQLRPGLVSNAGVRGSEDTDSDESSGPEDSGAREYVELWVGPWV
jgi:hypothetical protein